MGKMQLTALCLFGLESVLSFEVKRCGGENVSAVDGRVNFEGDEKVLAKANIWLRTAERVCIVLGSFQALTFTELFDGVEKLPFEKYIGKADAFPVKGWSIRSALHSIPSCQSIIKKAVVRRLEKVYKQELFSETGPVHQIRFSIYKDEATLMLDTSGASLYKRGYREQAGHAPIRETLAAGIADLARVRSDSRVYDPMCGSGTLLIEAAQKALNIAPGLNRSFAAEQWSGFPPELWKAARQEAKAEQRESSFSAVGSDIDMEVLAQARENAAKAGVAGHVQFERRDVADFAPESPAIVLCNPPYGERLLERNDAFSLYKLLGKVMPPKQGITYNIIAPQEDFEQPFGRRADKRRKLYNGMIQCQLYMYFK
ncbi:MAG: class I SAM-dependent RNA methyltransferase [Oscillospiraceae bacterium]